MCIDPNSVYLVKNKRTHKLIYTLGPKHSAVKLFKFMIFFFFQLWTLMLNIPVK